MRGGSTAQWENTGMGGRGSSPKSRHPSGEMKAPTFVIYDMMVGSLLCI